MANSNTEHSKKLRAKTAMEWQKKQLAEGNVKRLSLQLSKEVAELFDEVAQELGLSRPQTLKTVLEAFKANKK
ncbi:hypothetical protein [Ursidibacter arcticus]